jgi:hypothetical protein
MRRFSVRSLMVFIVGAAVGLAALRNANVYWAAGMSVAVLAALATSAVGIIVLRASEQCAWAGFAVFSGMYLACAVCGQFFDGVRQSFGPTVALNYLLSQVEQERRALLEAEEDIVKLARLTQKMEMARWIDDAVVAELKIEKSKLQSHRREMAQQAATAPWSSRLPGAANANAFPCVGHSLFALLSGLIGTVVGKIFYARRKRSEAQTP